MRITRRTSLGAGLLFLPALSAKAQPTPPRFAAVHDVVEALIAAGAIKGAQVVVMENGKPAYREAFGQRPDGRPVTMDTIVWLASLTKVVTAAAIMMMVDDGKVRLDAPVPLYIPQLASLTRVRVLKPGSPRPSPKPGAPPAEYDLVPAERPITIADLLTHTAGLQQINIPNAFIPVPAVTDTIGDWVPRLGMAPLEHQPGAAWGYSNDVAFDVLARVVEVTSGIPFDRFVTRRILEPLGMKDTGWGPSHDPRRADRLVAPTLGRAAVIDGSAYKSGGAGLFGPPDDYARFGQMLANNGEWNGKRLLKASSVAQMHMNHVGGLYRGFAGVSDADGYGFGYAVEIVLDAKAAKTALPNGSYGWNGAGGAKCWIIPAQNRVLYMWAQGDKAQAAIEAAVVSTIML
jgi:CubicO group peptidase (beta-lactamase class C family)